MAGLSIRACLRCHQKKVRCTGYPDCRNCCEAEIRCEPYLRPRRNENLQALRDAQKRLQWLEDELRHEFHIDCRTLATGTPLRHFRPQALPPSSSHNTDVAFSADQSPTSATGASAHGSLDGGGGAEEGNDASEISLLALNATGELKYLGPSSGAFFASYATALVRQASKDSLRSGNYGSASLRASVPSGRGGQMRVGAGAAAAAGILDEQEVLPAEQGPLSADQQQLLLHSYELWVQPLYPLFTIDGLRALVSRCGRLQTAGLRSEGRLPEPRVCGEMAIFYLVLALGATNLTNTLKQMQKHPSAAAARTGPSPAMLYSMALRYLDMSVAQLHPSVLFIQILLLTCIYSSYGPIGSSQWQLAGLAMRMAVEIGLHYAPRRTGQIVEGSDDADERSRTFWTAYIIEVSLAYNLGRPPSIGEEHITARLPRESADSALGVLHVRHRQIQSRIVAQVYHHRRGADAAPLSEDQRQAVLADLQAQLDDWRALLPAVLAGCPDSAYPPPYWERLYHGTSFVLHRASPLCPRPSPASLERCIRAAGAYAEAVAGVLRASHVPLSWMLVQGVLFAGLSLLVTARTGAARLLGTAARPQTHALSLLLVEVPGWVRTCSVCLAIAQERWREADLVAQLGAQFEVLADDTLRAISTAVAASQGAEQLASASSVNTTRGSVDEVSSSATTAMAGNDLSETAAVPSTAAQASLNFNDSMLPEIAAAEGWEDMSMFRDFFGLEGTAQTFWDLSPSGGGDGQPSFLQGIW